MTHVPLTRAPLSCNGPSSRGVPVSANRPEMIARNNRTNPV